MNNAPILWYSKKTCEASTFGSELVAMRTLTEGKDILDRGDGADMISLGDQLLITHVGPDEQSS